MDLLKLSEQHDFKVAKDSADIRGWRVLSSDAQAIGSIEDLFFDPKENLVHYAVIRLDQGTHMLWPTSRLSYRDAERRVVVQGLDAAQIQSMGVHEEPPASRRIQLVEEKLAVGKQRRKLGEASVQKRPISQEVSEAVPLEAEEVEVTRRPVDRPARENEQAIVEGDTIRIPVIAEKLHIEKRPYVVEEIVITKRRVSRTETVRETLRREEIHLEEPGRAGDEADTR